MTTDQSADIAANRAAMQFYLATWEPDRWTPLQLAEMSTPALAVEWERADAANQARGRAA